jgi:hypothetical protein
MFMWKKVHSTVTILVLTAGVTIIPSIAEAAFLWSD